MKIVCAIILLCVPLSLFADVSEFQNPKIRQHILDQGDLFFSKKDYKKAGEYYSIGINYWNEDHQKGDLERACKSLFAMLYFLKTHKKNKKYLKNCPKEIYDDWYGNADRDPVPILKITHKYPKKALNDLLEGWVILQFYVSKRGKITNTKVLESSESIFNRPALIAARQYLYLPAIRDGKPVKSNLIKNKLVFSLEQNVIENDF